MENLLTASELKDEALKRVKNLEPRVEELCSSLIEKLLDKLVTGKNSVSMKYNSDIGIVTLILIKKRLTDLGYKVEIREEERDNSYYDNSYYYMLNIRV